MTHSVNQVWSMIFEIGSRKWRHLYGDNRHNDGAAFDTANQQLAEDGTLISRLQEAGMDPTVHLHDKTGKRPDIRVVDATLVQHIVAPAKWVDGGCRTLDSDRTYFSAMAQTRITESIADSMRIPYPCFVVKLPPDLLVGEDSRSYAFAMFAQFENIGVVNSNYTEARIANASFYTIYATDGTNIHSFYPDKTIADHLFEPSPNFDPSNVEKSRVLDLPELAGDGRIREMVCQATAGLLFTMQHTKNWRYGSHFDRASGPNHDRRAPPPHRTIIVGSPIKLDVSSAVSADAKSGERSAPSVQTLVRGHLKRQVIGVGRSSRKVIWIEPYWRGPEDAPILVRPYKVESP